MYRPRNPLDKNTIEAIIKNNTSPVFADSNGLITRGTRDDDDDDYEWLPYRSDHDASADKKPAIQHKAGSKPVKHQPVKTHKDSETPATLDHIDLTRSDEESSRDTPEPGGASSPATKYLANARRDYTNATPPFVRCDRNFLSSKRVTLATANGQSEPAAVAATLITRAWDQKSSYYTLDRGGERIIVKPFGNRFGTQYRAWSGQGNAFENRPVAFGVNDDVEDQDDGKVSDNGLESGFENATINDSDSVGDGDYFPNTSETSSVKSQAKQRLNMQGMTTRSEPPEPSVTTRGYLTHRNQACGDPEETPSDDFGSSSRLVSPPPNPSLADTTKISDIVAGKRPANDSPNDDRSSKRVRPEDSNVITSNAMARVPPNLVAYKQDRTILYISLPGSNTDMVAIKLRSAMSIPTLFSSVFAAVGVQETEHLAIAVMLQGENGGPDRSFILRRETVEAFEFFLEAVDEASCWKEENGRLSFLLHVQMRFAVEMGVRI